MSFENVAKGIMVPLLDVLFETFELTLELVHFGSLRRSYVSPPGVDEFLEGGMGEPTSLKSKGSISGVAQSQPL